MKNGKDDQVARVRAIVNRAFAAEPDRDILREQLLKDLDEELNRSTILSLSAAARELGVALNTLRHQIDAGTGPEACLTAARRALALS